VLDVEGWYLSTAPVVASGTVLNDDGSPAVGASVELDVWPTGEAIDALPEGADIPVTIGGYGRTDEAGNYTVFGNLSSLTANYVEDDGSVNADLNVAVSSGTAQSFSLSAALPGSQAAMAGDGVVVPGAAPDTLDFDLHSQSVTETTSTSTPATTHVPTTAGAAPAGTDPDADTAELADSRTAYAAAVNSEPYPGQEICNSWKVKKHYLNRSEKFMNLYAYGNTVVEQTSSSSHSLGVGFAITGGSWGLSGHRTIETGRASGGRSGFSGNHQLYNEANEAHAMRLCWAYNNYNNQWYEHKIFATTFTFLLTSAPAIANRYWNPNYCHLYRSTPGTDPAQFFKNYGKNQEFSGGLDTPFINVSAQASFSNNTNVTWTVPQSGEYMCGTSSKGFNGSDFAGGTKYLSDGCGGPGTYQDTGLIDGDDAVIVDDQLYC